MNRDVGWSEGLSVGLRALFVGWYVQWCERRYDRARARYARASSRARGFMDRHAGVFDAVEGWRRDRAS